MLAAVGAAVGLGNIWKFPYVAGVSGGGAFVLVYVASVILVAIPILIAGWTLVYILKAANGFGGASALDVAQQFDELLASPARWRSGTPYSSPWRS
jgi:SNF family Na+-dependent transporter